MDRGGRSGNSSRIGQFSNDAAPPFDLHQARAPRDLHLLRRSRRSARMPYRSNDDLPVPLQRRLPPHAQDIYREAFNHSFIAHAGDPRQEEIAHRIAWAAVKRSYEKVGNRWIARRVAAALAWPVGIS
jgi:cation transport regulator